MFKLTNNFYVCGQFDPSNGKLQKITVNKSIDFYMAIMRYDHCTISFIDMVNGLHLYSAFIQSAVQFMPLIHTHIHTPTAIGCHARYQPARQEQLGVRCLAQGHFDTPRVGSNRQPSDCQTTGLTSWAISPLKWKTNCFGVCRSLSLY